MRAFSDHEVLRVWETGLALHPVDRALAVLATVFPAAERDVLVATGVGRRNERLMEVREANFGPGVSGVVGCPVCQETLEWTLDLDDVRASGGAAAGGPTARFAADGYELTYRLPDSSDLAAVVLAGDVAGGRATLLDRCVIGARRGDTAVETGSLPERVVSGLAAEMEARDPRAETLLDFGCPACGFRWQAHFDVLEFLWAEIQARAESLLDEVRALARSYGWSEGDVLGMSPVRRRFYLEITS